MKTVGYDNNETRVLRGLPYMGGKSAASPQGSGRWVAGLLPYRTLYAEPFAGMLGVLLQRAPSPVELVNDLDGHVHAWWSEVRDNPEELARRLDWSPIRSKRLYVESSEVLNTGAWVDQTDRAYRLAVVLTHAVNSHYQRALDGHPSGCRIIYQATSAPKVGSPQYPPVERMVALAKRLRRVQLENRDALEVLDRFAGESEAVVYVDPPYPSVDPLYPESVDLNALTEALKKQRGLCAVSGYENEWDHLDWPTRRERRSRVHLPNDNNLERRRLEVVWANGPLLEQGNLFDFQPRLEGEG